MQTIFAYIPIFVCIKSHILECMEMEYLQVQVKPKKKRVMLAKCNLKINHMVKVFRSKSYNVFINANGST
jgi:hypothetical protein